MRMYSRYAHHTWSIERRVNGTGGLYGSAEVYPFALAVLHGVHGSTA